MKQLFYAASLILLTHSGFTQTLQELVTKTDNENFEIAAAGYRNLLVKEPAKGENYFYYGENFFKSGDVDSANIYYLKGVEVNATSPLNYAGLGKVLLSKGKMDEAKSQFLKLLHWVQIKMLKC